MINQAPDFLPGVGTLGPTAGPGSLRTGSGSKNSAGCAQISPGDQFLVPFVGSRQTCTDVSYYAFEF
jgi:hypothetical protein